MSALPFFCYFPLKFAALPYVETACGLCTALWTQTIAVLKDRLTCKKVCELLYFEGKKAAVIANIGAGIRNLVAYASLPGTGNKQNNVDDSGAKHQVCAFIHAFAGNDAVIFLA